MGVICVRLDGYNLEVTSRHIYSDLATVGVVNVPSLMACSAGRYL